MIIQEFKGKELIGKNGRKNTYSPRYDGEKRAQTISRNTK